MSLTPAAPAGAANAGAAPAIEEAVSAVLWLWDSLHLEVGEVAVVTDGHPWARLAAVAATWYGARPVFVSRSSSVELPAVTHMAWSGADDETRQLAARLQSQPGVVIAELSGESGYVDLVLEAVPRNSRVIFAGPPGDRLTVDFYRNVHVKGLLLISGTLEGAGLSETRTTRARRLLSNPSIASACAAALRAGSRAPTA